MPQRYSIGLIQRCKYMARNYKARTLLALVTASLGIGGCGVLGSFSKLEGMEEEVAARVAATMTAQAHYSGEPTYAPPTPTPTSEPPALSPTEQSAPQEQSGFLDLAALQEVAITLGYTDRLQLIGIALNGLTAKRSIAMPGACGLPHLWAIFMTGAIG